MKKSLRLSIILVLATLILSISYLYYDATHFALTRLNVNYLFLEDKRIPQSLDGTRILYFSDLHLFSQKDTTFITQVFETIASEEADIILFGGDFIDASKSNINEEEQQYIDEQLSKLSPSLGFFAVLGQDDGQQIELLKGIYQAHTIELLENKAVLIRKQSRFGIQLFGYQGLQSSLELVDKNLFTLTFMYDPDWIDDFSQTSFDYILAAKTHGGQVDIPLLNPSYSRANAQYISGIHTLNNQTMMISNGIATLEYQARLFRDPSIYVITLKRK